MIRVGVAGWDYPDWAGIVYPAPLPRGFDRLAFLSGFFDAVEINVTFYRQIDAGTSASWVHRARSGDAFRFTAKVHRSLTHAGIPSMTPGTAEPDLPTEARSCLDGLRPLLDSGRLGAVLMQFPHAFHDRPATRRHLARVAELLSGLPLVAEFRHRSWDNEGALRFLKDLAVGFCNVDQPSIGSTLSPTEHVTSRIAYARLHGRNAVNWFVRKEKAGDARGRRETGSARYDYLYSMAELLPWVGRVRRMAERAEEVFIIANNHYRGKGPANALMMKSALASRRVRAPADLAAAFQDLKGMADPVQARDIRSPKQGRLF